MYINTYIYTYNFQLTEESNKTKWDKVKARRVELEEE